MRQRTAAPRIQIEYVRKFSALGKLQMAHWIRYQLNRTDDCWEIRLEQSDGKTMGRSEGMELDCSGMMAYNILRFLYENAIPMENWLDVAEDLVPYQIIRK